MLRTLAIHIIQIALDHIKPPKRGLRYVHNLLGLLGLEDVVFRKKLDAAISMQLTFRDHIQRQLLWYGRYERKELDLAKQLLPADGIVIDIGANIGYHTLLFSRHCTKGTVFAFEPATALYEKLLQHLEMNRCTNVSAHKLAVDANEIEKEFLLADTDNSGIGHFAEKGYYEGKTERVACTRLDDFILQRRITRIDLIKVDVEGAELRVLRGMAHVLKAIRPVVLLECSSENLSHYSEKVSTLFGFMRANGYTAFEPSADAHLHKIVSEKDMSLAFFIPEEQVGRYSKLYLQE